MACLLMATLLYPAGMAGPYALTGVFSLNDATPVLALMLGLAVGIDSLSMLPLPAAPPGRPGPAGGGGLAIGTAGSAVLFAGAPVVIAVVCGDGPSRAR